LEVYSDHAVIWTKPDDCEFDAKKPFAGLGGDRDGKFNVGMAVGSVRTLSTTLDAEIMRRIIERDDGEIIDFDSLDR
jgi:hypothetical protein